MEQGVSADEVRLVLEGQAALCLHRGDGGDRLWELQCRLHVPRRRVAARSRAGRPASRVLRYRTPWRACAALHSGEPDGGGHWDERAPGDAHRLEELLIR